jgi:hypothetical protein
VWGLMEGELTKFLLALVGVGVIIGILLCKVLPWLLSHIRIEWVS